MITASYLSIDDCLVSGNPVNGIPCYMVNADGKMYVLQVKKLQWKGWGKRNFLVNLLLVVNFIIIIREFCLIIISIIREFCLLNLIVTLKCNKVNKHRQIYELHII